MNTTYKEQLQNDKNIQNAEQLEGRLYNLLFSGKISLKDYLQATRNKKRHS